LVSYIRAMQCLSLVMKKQLTLQECDAKMALCGICGRELGTVAIDQHHLLPKTFKGKETVPLHKICHRKIHATFTERELANHYHTLERLREHSEIQSFVKWVAKKEPGYYSGSDETVERKKKRR
jgi:hypothetical protein